MSSRTPPTSIIHLGLDVHKESVTVAVLPDGAAKPTRIDRYPNDFAKLRKVFGRIGQDGELRACYEASGAGYVLHRAMREWGFACDVIAPSLIPKRPGVQRKHAKYDAAELARLYRAGELTAVHIRRKPKNACAMSCAVAKRFSARSLSPATTSSRFWRAAVLCIARAPTGARRTCGGCNI